MDSALGTEKERYKSFFELVNNDSFFRPLTGDNKQVYYDCIWELIKYSKNMSVLYELDARNCLDEYLENNNIQLFDCEDDVPGLHRMRGSEILRKFRRCGWMTEREVGKYAEYESHITSYCRRMIESLKSMEMVKNDEFTNRILEMYRLLEDAFSDDSPLAGYYLNKPYDSILKPLQEKMDLLRDELYDLREDGKLFVREIMGSQSIEDWTISFLKDKIDEFFEDFNNLTREGVIVNTIDAIEIYLSMLNTNEWIERFAGNYAVRENITYEEAVDDIQVFINNLESFLRIDYRDYINQINDQIASYYSAAAGKFKMFMQPGMNDERMLDEFLRKFNALGEIEQENVLRAFTECILFQKQEYVGIQSFKRPTKTKEHVQPSLREAIMSEDELNKLKESYVISPDHYSKKEVSEYLDALLGDETEISLNDAHDNILSKADVLSILQGYTFANESSFGYEYRLLGNKTVDFGFAVMKDLIIKRKEKKDVC